MYLGPTPGDGDRTDRAPSSGLQKGGRINILRIYRRTLDILIIFRGSGHDGKGHSTNDIPTHPPFTAVLFPQKKTHVEFQLS